ncbi:hypothetical protein BH24ACT5_BH24ACT5_19390 [soil metagenome]
MSRTSRWDRPRSPRDVRWFIRGVGKTLIVTGLLLFGFVAYQLWGTGIEYARAQDRVGSELDDVFAAADVPAPAATQPTPQAPTPTPTSVPTPAPTATVSPTTATRDATAPPGSTATSTSTTVAPTTSTTVAAPTTLPSFDLGYVERGKGVGYLQIPSIGFEDDDLTFVEGVGREDLHNGPGHYPSTPFPGELGNAAIAGHRTTWGAPFDHLPDIAVGDDIIVVTPYGGTFVYVMTSFEIVEPEDVQVIETVDTTTATLTLTTCHPRLTARQRYIVYAELDLTRSSPPGQYVDRSQGGVTELASEDVVATSAPYTPSTPSTPSTSSSPSSTGTITPISPVPTEAPEATEATPASAPTTATEPAPAATAPSDSLYSVVADGGGGEGAAGAGPVADGPVASEEAQDAFSTEWFADKTAIPQVALWAAACVAVVLAGYQLAKRYRKSLVGLAVGVAPFAVALYFFYQNVNRLLPAGI